MKFSKCFYFKIIHCLVPELYLQMFVNSNIQELKHWIKLVINQIPMAMLQRLDNKLPNKLKTVLLVIWSWNWIFHLYDLKYKKKINHEIRYCIHYLNDFIPKICIYSKLNECMMYFLFILLNIFISLTNQFY